jgi:hypothetical protein
MTRALLHLFLVFATLHVQLPCSLAVHSVCPCHQTSDEACQPCRDHSQAPDDCSCCTETPPADDDSAPAPHPEQPPGCPDDCPCMFCSAGFVPLTDFGGLSLSVERAFGSPLTPAAPSDSLAGHRTLLDRPPRVA